VITDRYLTKKQDEQEKLSPSKKVSYYYFFTLSINNPEEFKKKIMLHDAKELEWPSIVLLGKAIM